MFGWSVIGLFYYITHPLPPPISLPTMFRPQNFSEALQAIWDQSTADFRGREGHLMVERRQVLDLEVEIPNLYYPSLSLSHDLAPHVHKGWAGEEEEFLVWLVLLAIPLFKTHKSLLLSMCCLLVEQCSFYIGTQEYSSVSLWCCSHIGMLKLWAHVFVLMQFYIIQ